MAQGFPLAWQGSLAAAASTLVLALAVFCGLWCPRAALVNVHRGLSMSPGTLGTASVFPIPCDDYVAELAVCW